MTTNIGRESIIDSWNMLIEHASEQEKRVMDEIAHYITDARIPNVTLRRDECATSFLREKREFLILDHSRYREYRMFLGARNYGATLDAGWFLTFVSYSFLRKTPQSMGMFAQQDLRAFVGIAHHSMKKVLEALCEKLEQSPAGLNTASKGYLSVW